MRTVIDTNIIIDVMTRREPFFEHSQKVLELVAKGEVTGGVSANSIADIAYLLRKHMGDDSRRVVLRGLMELVDIISVSAYECTDALELPVSDYEDALLVSCAKTWAADCIVTRDKKHFAASPVKTISPKEFVENFV